MLGSTPHRTDNVRTAPASEKHASTARERRSKPRSNTNAVATTSAVAAAASPFSTVNSSSSLPAINTSTPRRTHHQQQQQQDPPSSVLSSPGAASPSSPLNASITPAATTTAVTHEFANRLSTLVVDSVASKLAKQAVVFPQTRVPPQLYLYKQNAANMPLFGANALQVSTTIGSGLDATTTSGSDGALLQQQQQQQQQKSKQRWLPSETPTGFDRMEMKYVAQLFDKLTSPGEVADMCVNNDRAKQLFSSDEERTASAVLSASASTGGSLLLPPPTAPPAESVLRLSQKMEGLLIGLHEVSRLVAPASPELTAIGTLAVDKVRSVFYDLLAHMEVLKAEAKREKDLRLEVEQVATKLRGDLNELTEQVGQITKRMDQHYETKPEYIENRKNAPNILLPCGDAPSIEELTKKERREYDSYVPSQNRSLHKTFVHSVLESATPGTKAVTSFGREQHQEGNDQVGDDDDDAAGNNNNNSKTSTMFGQESAMMVSSERTCKLPSDVTHHLRRRHPPITKSMAVDTTDLFFHGHKPNPSAVVSLSNKPSSSDPSSSSATADADTLFNFALPAPRVYAHEGVLFVQPALKLFQGSKTVVNSSSHVLGTTMRKYSGIGNKGNSAAAAQGENSEVAVAADPFAKFSFTLVGELDPSALDLPESSALLEQQQKPSTGAGAASTTSGGSSPKNRSLNSPPPLRSPSSKALSPHAPPPHASPTTTKGSPTTTRRSRKSQHHGGKGGGGGGGTAERSASPTGTSNNNKLLASDSQDTSVILSDGLMTPEASISVTAPPLKSENSNNNDSRLNSPGNPPVDAGSMTRRPSANNLAASAANEGSGDAAVSNGSFRLNNSSFGSFVKKKKDNTKSQPAAGSSLSVVEGIGANSFKRVGNAVVNLIRKRAQSSAALNCVHVEVQTDPPPLVSVEVQTGPMRDAFGLRVGGSNSKGSGGGGGGGNALGSTKRRGKSVGDSSKNGSPSTTSPGNNKNAGDSGGFKDVAGSPFSSPKLGSAAHSNNNKDFTNVLTSFQEELGMSTGTIRRTGKLNESGGVGGSDAAAAAAAAAASANPEALLDATYNVRDNVSMSSDASVNTDVTLSNRELIRMAFLDAIVAANVRSFDGVAAHRIPDYAIVPDDFASSCLLLLSQSNNNNSATNNATDSPTQKGLLTAGGGSNEKGVVDDSSVLPPDAAAALLPGGGGGMRRSSTGDTMFSAPSDNFSFDHRNSVFGSSFAASAAGGGGLLDDNGEVRRGSYVPGGGGGGLGGRKQQRNLHTSTVLFATSLPPVWRAELGQRPNFAGARIKSREWTYAVVLECYRSVDVLLICPSRCFAMNVVEYVSAKFGDRKQYRPYLFDTLVNVKVQSLSSMRCFAFIQLAELAGFAGIDDLPEVRASSSFLFYYVFVIQRLLRTLSFRGMHEFTQGTLALNREAVVALLDAHLCHVASSYSDASEYEVDRRQYYNALLSLKNLTNDELSVIRFQQQMQCIVDGTKCPNPGVVVRSAADEITADTQLFKKLEGLNSAVPIHADVVTYLMVRNHDSLVEMICERAKMLHEVLQTKYQMKTVLTSNTKGVAFEANVVPPPQMIALQLLPVSTPVAVPMHPLIAGMEQPKICR